MNQLARVAVFVTVALGVSVAPAPAQADPIGGVIVIPGTGTNLDPMRLRTSAGCPAQANAYYASMRGHGLSPDGQIITAPIQAGLSHSSGFDVYVALVMRDYANNNNTTLAGRYDITVYCIDQLTQNDYGEFTGSLRFTSPSTYEAIGAAKPVGSPPAPLPLAGVGLDLAPASPPTRSAPPDPPAQSPAQSPAEQLASQRNVGTIQGVPWLILVLVGAVLGALVAAIATTQMAKRRSS
jgi:hypothetical protein